MPSAPLTPLSLASSGVFGLNSQNSNAILDPKWATKALNMVFDNTNRLTSRSGWNAVTTTAVSGNIAQVFEYTPITGSNVVISAAGNKLYSGTTTLTNITGSLTITADNWKFVNFNGNVYGLQAGHPLIVWSGSGNFTTVTAATGTVPNGNELLSAFGRLWGVDSTGQVLKYCNLLDATNWSVTGAGSFNLTSVWGTGNDSIVALASFNNLLVIFGSRNIVIFQDGTGSVLGMDPIHMAVSDMVSGIGCVVRDSVQNTNGDDLIFLASSGLQSLKRVIIERSNAIRNISMNVRDALLAAVAGTTASTIRSSYNAFNGFYAITLPSATTTFVFDTRMALEDGTWRCTTWNGFQPTALYTPSDNKTLYAGSGGKIFTYGIGTDNGAIYTASFESGWLDLGPEVSNRDKILKRVSSMFSSTKNATLSYKWAFDFSDTFTVSQVTLPNIFSSAEWGSAEWGLAMWGGGPKLLNLEIPASGAGQFIKVGIDFPITTSVFALNQMQIYAKEGRIT